jgi:hypothetical protein
MANQQIDQHFDKFIKERPSSTYEDWIAELNPQNAKEDMLGLGQTVIDSKFYQPDSEYLKYWNTHLDSTRLPVVSNSQDGNESDGSADKYKDLLFSGDGDDNSQSSPTSERRRIVHVSPGEDLMRYRICQYLSAECCIIGKSKCQIYIDSTDIDLVRHF